MLDFADFAVVPFLLLDVRSSIEAWRQVSFYGLYLVFVPFLALNVLGGLAHLKRLQRKRDARAASGQGKLSAEEREQERKRVEWEKQEEEKRMRRGEGVPSLGLDVEGMVEEEERMSGVEAKKEL